MKINNFEIEPFLREYWQKKPTVVRKAFSDPFWLEPDDLAGLSLEESVESRIITQEKNHWKVEHGPFDDALYSNLPKSDWTLLVQAVDQWVPEIKEILDSFSFLPSWRLDDIMVSYAPVGGTVSQHFDFFDVFLIQGVGRRKWQVGAMCSSESELLPDIAVKILKDFTPELEFTLEPGDMLYIPAKYSHSGISVEDSMTYSVGFRAPSVRDVVDGIATKALETLTDDERYRDNTESLGGPRGEISVATIDAIQEILTKGICDKSLVASWLGQYLTEPKYPELELIQEDIGTWQDRLRAGEPLYRNPASRFAYIKDKSCILFVDGQSYEVEIALARQLSDTQHIDNKIVLALIEKPVGRAVVQELLQNGSLTFLPT